MRPRNSRQPNQLEMFPTPSNRPRWQDLPPQVQREATQALARLLESAQRAQAQDAAEGVEDE